ncbi:MAG: CoxG family protein, partial [Actinomycetota bacterium]
VEAVGPCLPGVSELRATAPNHYDAVLAVQIGPIKASFTGSIAVDDSDSPERLVASAKGKDRSSGSLASVGLDARLAEDPPGLTTVETRAEVTLRGRLGGFGTGVIQATATAMLGDFVACVGSRLAAPEGSASPTPARPLPLLKIVLLGLWARLRSLVRSARAGGEKRAR